MLLGFRSAVLTHEHEEGRGNPPPTVAAPAASRRGARGQEGSVTWEPSGSWDGPGDGAG